MTVGERAVSGGTVPDEVSYLSPRRIVWPIVGREVCADSRVNRQKTLVKSDSL